MGTKWSLLWKRLRSTLQWVLPTTLRILQWVLPTTLRVYGLRPSGKTTGSTLTIPDLRNKLLYG